MFGQFRQFHVRQHPPAPRLIDERLPAFGRRLPLARPDMAASSVFERLQSLRPANPPLETGRVVARGCRVVAGVLGRARRLERVRRRVFHHRREVRRKRNQRQDVPRVVAKYRADVRGVAAALEAEVPFGHFRRRTVVLAFEPEQFALDHRQTVGFDHAAEQPPVRVQQVEVG